MIVRQPDTAETALERAVRHARERPDTRCGWIACALPAVQPTTTPTPSVASIPALADSVMNANLAPQRFAGERLQG